MSGPTCSAAVDGRAGSILPLPLAIAAILVCAGCSRTPAADAMEQTTIRDSTGIVIVENHPSSATPVCDVAPEPSLTIGAQDGPPEYQLHRTFGARRLSDGRIAIVNQGSQELRFYDAEGGFLGASGRVGEGPGEFRNAFTLTVLPGDTLWVGDFSPWEWEVFGPDGRWARVLRPAPPHVNSEAYGVLDDGRVAISERSLDRSADGVFTPRKMTVTLHARDGSLADTVGTFEMQREGRFEDVLEFISTGMFDPSSRVVTAGTRIVTAHTSRPELRIVEVEDTLRLDRIVRWEAEERPVTDALIEAERERLSGLYPEAPEADRRAMIYPQVREDRPVAKSFPYFSSVVVGRDGRIWVRDYKTPLGPETDEWLVFAADGSLQCRVQVFPFEQMPEFGSDYILVMKRDELGIERIFLHQLSAPRAVEGEV